MSDQSDFQKLGLPDALAQELRKEYGVRDDALELISIIDMIEGSPEIIVMMERYGLELRSVYKNAWNLIDPKIREKLENLTPPPVIIGVPKPDWVDQYGVSHNGHQDD